MKRPQLTQEIIDKHYPELITEETLDGEGLPYYNEPAGVYRGSDETEDELEMARR